MEKTLLIDGKNIRFKCTAGTLIRYRNQFNREFLADIAKLKSIKETNMSGFLLSPFYDIVWIMAKTADDSIPDPLTWYDSFDEFPILDVFPKLQELLIAALKTKNSQAAVHPAAKRRRKRR